MCDMILVKSGIAPEVTQLAKQIKDPQGPQMTAMWGSIEDSQAALSVLRPEVNRLLGPLMAALSEFIGAGEVLSSDLARQD